MDKLVHTADGKLTKANPWVVGTKVQYRSGDRRIMGSGVIIPPRSYEAGMVRVSFISGSYAGETYVCRITKLEILDG